MKGGKSEHLILFYPFVCGAQSGGGAGGGTGQEWGLLLYERENDWLLQ